MRWSGAAVRAALALPPAAAEEPDFTGVSTDTRTVTAGQLFVALTGERFDGHDHLSQALAAGAAGAVVRRGTPAVPGLTLFEVPDTLRALGQLARARREEIRGPVVAITGTNGKTSTKEMVAAVLATRERVHATRANLNNLVGVPLTILEAPEETTALVVEAGASVPGEIARYRGMIEPTVAMVTNVGAGHLEGFGSLADVRREKLALVQHVALAVVGTTPPELATDARAAAGRVITAGLGEADVQPDDWTLDGLARATVSVDGQRFSLSAAGAHLVGNAMFAWALVRELGLDPAAAAAALSRVTVPGGRGQLRAVGGLTVLDDCYNANPESFRAAIAAAAAMRAGRRLVFVAGTMRELGPDSDRLHREVAGDLVALQPDLLAVVGQFGPPVAGMAERLAAPPLIAPDPEALGPRLAEQLRGDELVVLKASRGVALERILRFLPARPDPSS